MKELNDEIIRGVMDRHVEKPNRRDVMDAFHKGEVGRSAIRRFYVYDLMCDVIAQDVTRSMNDLFTTKEGITEVYSKAVETGWRDGCLPSEELPDYEYGKAMWEPLMSYVQMFTKSFSCGKATDFPYERCRELIRKYNTNGVMYDPSCGWGSRLSAALVEHVTYHGTDPNDKLVPRLEMMAKDLKESLHIGTEHYIYCHGSEVFMPELEGKCGLALTSPPYFDLEDYRHGDGQSIKLFNTYDVWKEKFLLPTFQNCYKYLTPEGNLLINVKNFGKYKLFDDMVAVAARAGFKHVCDEPIKVASMRFARNDTHKLNNDELCAVFIKKDNPELKTGCGINELF